MPGTPYDDAWRAINQLLIHGSIASHQRNVFLRNDGHGGFDEVAGALGLDLDQDGRSFAVLDIDRDGDPDLAVMAARQAPQLRVFRNDFETTAASLAVQARGHEEQPRCDWRSCDGADGPHHQDQSRDSRVRISLAALEGAPHWSGCQRADREADRRVAVGRHADAHRRAVEYAPPDRRSRAT